MIIRRNRVVYALLLAAWVLVVAWQVMEHNWVTQSARTALINRSRDITATLGLVIRSQRRFGGIISEERLESALKELVKSGELSSVALFNAAGEVVTSAGGPIDFDAKWMMQTGERWDARSVTIVNPVDLGSNVTREGETNRPTIVLPRRDPANAPRDEERARGRFEPGPGPGPSGMPPPPPPPPPEFVSSNILSADLPGTNTTERVGPRRGWPRSGRPFGMDEKEYKALLERRGLHGLVIAMSTGAIHRACTQDLWLRCIIGCFAGVSGVGLGLAWRNLAKSSDLQMRLLRASELNLHLKEMNLAAAGLAHETRNPLNIIRGLAQMISKQQDASPEVRRKSREIVDETDRVTAQLNEFINYSRPREVRRTAVLLGSVVGEVARALRYDLEEKNIHLQTFEERIAIEADEQLLRQALFNLLLNAIQAAEPQGQIQVVARATDTAEAFLEMRDNGPGVAVEHRAEIFKPYFTTHQNGTGLGLAVVQQIVLAHGWEIACLPNDPRGAVFRIDHLKLSA